MSMNAELETENSMNTLQGAVTNHKNKNEKSQRYSLCDLSKSRWTAEAPIVEEEEDTEFEATEREQIDRN